MFLRAADILEMAEVFYPVIIAIGNAVQLLILAIHRKDISILLEDIRRIVALCNTSIPSFSAITVFN